MKVKQAAPFTPALGQTQDSRPIPVANPLSLEQAVLRPSLLPALLQNAVLNFHRQNAGIQFFEVGRIFFQNQEGRHERRRLALLLAGDSQEAHWRLKKKKADYFDLSGTAVALFNALHISNYQFLPNKAAAFHPKRCSVIMSGSTVLGWIGEIHPDLNDQLDTTETASIALDWLDTQALLEATPEQMAYVPASPFPPVRRDLSMVAFGDTTPYEKIAKTSERPAGGKDLESVSLIDLYQGDKIGMDHKSMTVTLIFRNKEKTLADADIEKITQKMISDLEKKCEVTLRK